MRKALIPVLILLAGAALIACSKTDENLRYSSIPLPDAPNWEWIKAQPGCENIEMNLATYCPPWEVCVIEERDSAWCRP